MHKAKKPARPKRVTPSLEKFEEAKHLYERGAPISRIRALLEMTEKQFRAFRDVNGWPPRQAVADRWGRTAMIDLASPEKPPPETLIARVEKAVEHEFARAEQALGKKSTAAMDRSARALASLVKTLGELKRMRREAQEEQNAGAGADHDGGSANDRDYATPSEMAELRAELARRLERLSAEGEAG